MADKTYQIVVTGQMVPGTHLEQAKEKVAKLFNAPAAKLSVLFSGNRVVVKKGLDEAAAFRYVATLLDIGLACVAEPMGDAHAAAETPVRSAAPTTLAPVGVTLVEAPRITPPQIDTSALSVAAAGGNLVEFTPPPAPDIDISRLTAAPPGEMLVDTPAVPAADIDISRLTLSEPGERLVNPPVVAAADIDISYLDIAPVGSDVGELRRTDFPSPLDVSHLKIES